MTGAVIGGALGGAGVLATKWLTKSKDEIARANAAGITTQEWKENMAQKIAAGIGEVNKVTKPKGKDPMKLAGTVELLVTL